VHKGVQVEGVLLIPGFVQAELWMRRSINLWFALGFSPVLKGDPGVARVKAKKTNDMKSRRKTLMTTRLMT